MHHPDRDLGALLEKWGFEVGRAWVAGQPRTTPEGTRLEGVWPDSYAYARLPADGTTLAHRLRLLLPTVEAVAPELVALVESGGAAELFVGWHFQRNSGDMLDWALMRRLADCRLSLSLDIYPEREPEEHSDD
ncbi:MAG: hypothetical protein ABWX67_07585 [Allosphingosinicella sp.]